MGPAHKHCAEGQKTDARTQRHDARTPKSEPARQANSTPEVRRGHPAGQAVGHPVGQAGPGGGVRWLLNVSAVPLLGC